MPQDCLSPMIDFETYTMGDDQDILVMAVSGRLDTDSSEFFFDCVKSQIEEGHTRLVIDFRDVDYISSLGLGTLVRAHARMKKVGGNVKLARINALVAEILTRVGFQRLFQIYPTVSEACAAFDS